MTLESIADGSHVVVLHPGVDLATALACGEIPAAAGQPVAPPGVVPSATPVTSFTARTSPTRSRGPPRGAPRSSGCPGPTTGSRSPTARARSPSSRRDRRPAPGAGGRCPAPRLAKLQAKIDELLATYIDAYTILADAFESQDRSLLTRADAKGRDTDTLAKQLQADARELLTPCGIRLGA